MQINLHIAICKPYFCRSFIQSWCVTFFASKKVNFFSIGVNLFSKRVKSLRFLRFYLNNRVNLFRVNQGLVMSCIPVQHGVSLILPQETSPSCASKNCLHLSRVPVQFSFSSCSVLVQYLVPRYCRSSVGVLSEQYYHTAIIRLSIGYPTEFIAVWYGVYWCVARQCFL